MSKAEPLKIPMKAVFKDEDGDIFDVTGESKKPEEVTKPLTMRHVCIVACTAEFQDQLQKMNPADLVGDKIKRFELYNKLLAAEGQEQLELDPESASYLKPRVARCFGVLIAGPAMLYLDGKNP